MMVHFRCDADQQIDVYYVWYKDRLDR
jgi:hypothetical protein